MSSSNAAAAAEYYFLPLTRKRLEEDVIPLEAESYPPDEAASGETLRFRFEKASRYFWMALRRERQSDQQPKDTLIGYICSTCSAHEELTEESMKEHDDNGKTLCIHSVVVDARERRQGLATWMLRNYLRSCAFENPHLHRACLITKEHNINLYARVGFQNLGKSDVEHGQDVWYDMEVDFRGTTTSFPFHTLEQYQIDSFSDQAFGGNPAAVVVFPITMPSINDKESWKPYLKWMQDIALENNLSETAFVAPREPTDKAGGNWVIRWMTPTKEVDLCGHATLAAAYVLKQYGFIPRIQDRIAFESLSGILSIGVSGLTSEMTFPAQPVAQVPEEEQNLVATACEKSLGVQANQIQFVGSNQIDVLVEVTPQSFHKIPKRVDAQELERIPARVVIITTTQEEGSKEHVHSRGFAPRYGVTEDPVTGSAHCAIGPYWIEKLGIAKGSWLVARQGGARQGKLEVTFNDSKTHVIIRGDAVPTIAGRLSPQITETLRQIGKK